jgi:RES domain-containing protein
MLRLWRLYREQYGPGLDGIGGTFASGRWHRRGQRVVYFGNTAAIVVLERLAHLDPDLLPNDLRLGSFTFDIDVPVRNVADIAQLEEGWTHNEDHTQRLGAEWISEGKGCVLVVPSAILPEESNLVLNPRHPRAGSLRQMSERRFRFDARLI